MSALRVHLCFLFFVLATVALVARVAWLQIGGAAHARARVERQKQKREELPAQRGTIVDRDERVLACDRQVLEARAEIAMRVEDRTQPGLPMDRVLPWLDEIARALALDPELREAARKKLVEDARHLLFKRVIAAAAGHVRESAVRSGQKEIVVRRVEILVANEVCSTAVVDALRALERRRDTAVRFTFVKGWRRSYPEREVTIGPVGFVSDLDLDRQGNPRVMRGMEQIAGLLPGDDGERLVDRDARANAYWTLAWTRPDAPSVVHTTLDLSLQKAAQELLAEAAQKVKAKYDTEPDWGALMLVEIETGAVRAMASWQARVDPKAARFAPTQCVYQPGSVVKPLVFALALERGVLKEDDLIDCTPNTSGMGFKIPGRRNAIHDVHATQGAIPPHDILVRSSNIGAFQVGMRLGRGGLEEYLARAGFARRTDLKLPHELAGRRPKALAKVPEREFLAYTGPSIGIGYEIDATPAQLTRAFLTLLSGRPRELRLFDAIDDDEGVRTVVPASDAGSARYLSEDTVAWIRRALGDVVSDEPHSTGHELFRQLKEMGITKGVIAGKTGTSERTAKDGSWVRSATFAGFAPVDAPRWLAVCVLQKERANLFYGGLYAAPAAGRLLLAALGAELRQRQRVELQVSADSIDRGGQTPFAIQGGR